MPVRKLFEATEHDSELRDALLAVKSRRDEEAALTHAQHQSVGEALMWKHFDVVRYLCAQPGIESHLRFVDGKGETVFHKAARTGNLEMFRLLAAHWPDRPLKEGVNRRSKGKGYRREGSMALELVVYDFDGGDAAMLETVEFLLKECGADTSSPDDDEAWYASPLCIAVRRGKLALSRALVVHGAADVWGALEVEQPTGRPILRNGWWHSGLGD